MAVAADALHLLIGEGGAHVIRRESNRAGTGELVLAGGAVGEGITRERHTWAWARGVTYVLVAHRDGTANDCVVANVSGIVLATPSGPNTSSHSGPQTVAERAAIPSAIQVFMMPFRTLGQR